MLIIMMDFLLTLRRFGVCRHLSFKFADDAKTVGVFICVDWSYRDENGPHEIAPYERSDDILIRSQNTRSSLKIRSISNPPPKRGCRGLAASRIVEG